MAVIVQADPFDRLIRKIGYSVGLEDLVNRVKALVTLYARDGSISAPAFRDLIEKKFKRRNAVEHFANFYSQLNLVRAAAWDHGRGPPGGKKAPAIPKTLQPLYQLDSLSILQRMLLPDDAKYDAAVKVVLTQSIIEEDGDIFLNALLSDFQPDAMRVRFESMIRTKRQLLGGVVRNPAVVAKVNRIINIKNESTRPSLRVKEEIVGRFGKRTHVLSSSTRQLGPLTAAADELISIPDDYIEKVRRTRAGWAEDLELFCKGGKTSRGARLLADLEHNHWGSVIPIIDARPTAVFWGYQSDLERLRINPDSVRAAHWEAWDLLNSIALAARAATDRPPASPPTADDVFDLLRWAFELYRSGNTAKGLIRNSLPLYVAEPVLVGSCVAEGRAIPDLRAILTAEFHKKARRVQKMIIRGTAGALFFTKESK